MHRYQSRADACFGMVLLLAVLEALVMGYGNFDLLQLRIQGESYVPSLLLPFSVLLLFSCVARWQLVRAGVQWWAYLGILLPTLWVMFFSGNWFTTGFHDLAMEYFDSHGRFGCRGGQNYIFCDDTAPWVLHGPIVAATLAHWLWQSPTFVARLSRYGRLFVRWSTTYESRKSKPAA